jgi:hypothetical protein
VRLFTNQMSILREQMGTIRTDRFSHIVPFDTFHLCSQVTQFDDGLIHEFLCSYVQYPPRTQS